MHYKMIVYGPDKEIDFEVPNIPSKKAAYTGVALSFDIDREVNLIDMKTKKIETFTFCKEDLKKLVENIDWEEIKKEQLSLFNHTIRVQKIRLAIPSKSPEIEEAREAISFDCLDDEITKIESTLSELVKDHDERVKRLRDMDEYSLTESKKAIESIKRIDSCLKES